jgi:hypothetical protein
MSARSKVQHGSRQASTHTSPDLGGQLPGDLLFVDLAGTQVAVTSQGLWLRHQRGRQHTVRDLVGIVFEILVQDMVGAEQTMHPFRAVERAEFALEDQTIKALKHTGDEQGKTL